jgi:hypothetical protein
MFLSPSQTLADEHRERECGEGGRAVEAVDELLRPCPCCENHDSEHDLHSDRSDHRAEKRANDWEYLRTEQAHDRGERTTGGHDGEYETVPIVDEHIRYRTGEVRNAEGRWSHHGVAQVLVSGDILPCFTRSRFGTLARDIEP